MSSHLHDYVSKKLLFKFAWPNICHYIVLVKALAALWRKPTPQGYIPKEVFSIPEQDTEDAVFKLKYDSVQKQLQSIAGLDDLVSGLLLYKNYF